MITGNPSVASVTFALALKSVTLAPISLAIRISLVRAYALPVLPVFHAAEMSSCMSPYAAMSVAEPLMKKYLPRMVVSQVALL